MPEQHNTLPKPLLIPVKAHEDEALMSILIRASRENILGRAAHLVSLAGIETNRVEHLPFTKLSKTERLAALLGMPDREVRHRMHSSADEYIDWYGTPLPRRFIETRRIRFDETGGVDYVRAAWAIRPLDFCPETRSLLRSSCDACGTEQRWASAKELGSCHHCGASLAAFSLTDPDIPIGAVLAARLVSIDEEQRTAAVAQLPSPFNSWQAGEVFQAVVELGLVGSSPIAPIGCSRFQAIVRGNFENYDCHQLAAGFEFVRGWPESLYQHVKDVARGRSGKIRALLGRLGKYTDPKGPDSPLRAAMDIELPNAIAAMDVPLKAYKAGGIVSGRRGGVMTVSEAALTFNVDKQIISKLQASPRCLVSRGASKSSVILLDQVAVDCAMTNWQSGLTYARAAIAIGSPLYVISALVDAGLLQAVSCPDATLLADGTSMVTANSVQDLRRAISNSACDAIDDSMACDLREGMVRILHAVTWVEVIQGLIRGEIAHTRPIDDRRFLHTIVVSSRALERFRSIDVRRPLPDVLVSGVVAADLLAVNSALVSGAVGAGLIRGSKRAGRLDIPLSEVRRYGIEFIGAEEVRRDIGLKPRDLATTMRVAGFDPAGQKHNTFYWRRADVRHVFGSRVE